MLLKALNFYNCTKLLSESKKIDILISTVGITVEISVLKIIFSFFFGHEILRIHWRYKEYYPDFFFMIIIIPY